MSDEKKTSWFQRLKGKKAEATPAPAAETAPAQPSTEVPKAPLEIPVEAPVEVQVEAHQTPTQAPVVEPVVEPVPAPQTLGEAAPLPTPAPDADPSTDDVAEDTQKGWYTRLKQGLKKSTSAVSDGITGIFTKRKLDDDTLEELEDLLITADLGVSVAGKVVAALSKDRYNKEISDEEVKDILATEIEAILAPVAKPLTVNPANKPHVILMAGVNGAGKTTTIGKLGKKFKEDGKRVMLAAGDTFRAAAVEQLQVWGERVGVPVITKDIGSDAAALAYEAMERAIADDIDVLLIDTAGRLQNRDELMAELAKVVRVIGKKIDGAPHDTIIVLDATTGQNAVHQVEVFQKLANISGIVMTKLDGSARGGVLVACADKFGLPVHAIGVGEAIEDLQPFDPRDFAKALVGIED